MSDVLVKVPRALLERAHVPSEQEAEQLVAELLEEYADELEEEDVAVRAMPQPVSSRTTRPDLPPRVAALVGDVDGMARAWAEFVRQVGAEGLEPIGVEALRERIAQNSDLEPNEFSRGIIAMREE